MRDALTAPVADVLAAAPERTAVLKAVGLVERDGDELPPHPSAAALTASGLGEVERFTTVPGGPVLVAARRP
jgi:hypothetical protein